MSQTHRRQSEKQFWAERFSEHAFFLYKLLDPEAAPNLKKSAFTQLQNWNHFIEHHLDDKFDQLLTDLLNLKNKMYDAKKAGKDIGPIPISLVEHMIKELEYFVKVYNNDITFEEEVDFWLQEAAEHTALTAHLLDPSEKKLTEETLKMAKKLESASPENLKSVLTLLHKSNQKAVELREKLDNNEVQVFMMPLMLEHEILEAEHGEQILNKYLHQQ